MSVKFKYRALYSGNYSMRRLLISGSIMMLAIISIVLALSCERSSERAGLTDIDGNVYDTVVIGTQVWIAENLRTTRLNDGTEIPLVADDTAWSNLTTPGYCWYGNYEAFFKLNHYGSLYNYYAVTSGKLCPAGWHVPDHDEWYTLFIYLGENQAGGKMKETGTLNWLSPNTGATNESGFNALPGGKRNAYYKDSQGFRSSAYFWASEAGSAMGVSYNSTGYVHYSMSGTDGISVRCVKD
jgi:uncharacterized protein (TIGR02145 family)